MNVDEADPSFEGVPLRTPLFEAQHSDRYARQQLIKEYQERFDCRLVVLIDQLMPCSIPLFEETLFDADPKQHLHVLLRTLGGDGEAALQLAQQAQARCHELTIIVPDKAKSAGTLLALGAHNILMGPTSDLGPIDPQFQD
jgi:ATP-dependent protease ClpP protease subunit